MKIGFKIELQQPADKTMEAALANREIESFTTTLHGNFVTFDIECTPFQAFKLGQVFSHLSNQ